MDPNIISDSSALMPSSAPIARSSSYNLNFKTVFLFIILITACCLFSIGYDFQFNMNSGISWTACIILTMFLFYVLYEFFKSNDCDSSGEQKFFDRDKLFSAMGRGRSYIGEQGTKGIMAMGNAMNAASQRITNPYANSMSDKLNAWVQPRLSSQYQNPQYQNTQYQNPQYQPIM